jgi:hypothetical protein
MDYTPFIKKLELPADSAPPARLTYDNLIATAITRAHLQDDVAGINASIELIQRTRGGRWPTGPVTEEHNYTDLVWHEAEFRNGSSFTYAVYDSDKRYLGCCYLSPLGRRTTLSEGLLAYDVDVSWWVTPAAYQNGHYAKLYTALQHWLADEFPSWKPYYSNTEIPRLPRSTSRAIKPRNASTARSLNSSQSRPSRRGSRRQPVPEGGRGATPFRRGVLSVAG